MTSAHIYTIAMYSMIPRLLKQAWSIIWSCWLNSQVATFSRQVVAYTAALCTSVACASRGKKKKQQNGACVLTQSRSASRTCSAWTVPICWNVCWRRGSRSAASTSPRVKTKTRFVCNVLVLVLWLLGLRAGDSGSIIIIVSLVAAHCQISIDTKNIGASCRQSQA